jgi:hypothetical protein
LYALRCQKEKEKGTSKPKESKKPSRKQEEDGDYEDPPTVLGEKKQLAPDMAKSYDPTLVEAR